MSQFRRSLRQTLTIARRDFIATVVTPVFLVFLLAPVLMGLISGSIGGLSAAGMSSAPVASRAVVIAPPALARPLAAADTALRAVFRDRSEAPPPLVTLAAAADPAAQARAVFADRDDQPSAVLYGALDHPTILYAPDGERVAGYLTVLAGRVLATERLGDRAAVTVTRVVVERHAGGVPDRHPAAFVAVFGIFFLTLFLAGQVVGSMAEERNNKVIEVLAAAVPLETVFLGKLLGMFGAALVFILFWGVIGATFVHVLPPAMIAAVRGFDVATGGVTFTLLFVGYFAMAYLLLGAVFLGVGAQATTPREIQLLSLPITLVQIAMFGFASAAASAPGGTMARAAEIFPLSSPFAMAGHAAASPALWPHALALAWQALWVAIFVTVGARAFRRGVLQSGSARPRRWSRRKPIDIHVS